MVRPGWVGRQPQSLWNVVGGRGFWLTGTQQGVAAQLLLGAELAQAVLGCWDRLAQIQAPERASRRDGVTPDTGRGSALSRALSKLQLGVLKGR